jgi:LysR family transcriptional regulator, mexEF-oprN operon transcriptional activator
MNHEFREADLRRVDLNLLLVLAALVRERSVTRAAARLHLSAPAVSMALARLRAALGDRLFVRGREGMEPTPRALEVYAAVAPALQGVHDAVFRPPRFEPALAERTFRFASPDDLELVLLPRLLARVAAEAPRATLVVRPADFRNVPGMLDSGDAELALTATPPGLDRGHRHEPLHRDGFAAVFDRGRLGLGEGEPLTPERYLEAPHVLLSPAGHTTGPVDARLAELGLGPRRVVAAVARFSTLPFVLRALPAVANMPSVAARHHAAAFGLDARPLPFATPTFEVSLVWHARSDGDAGLAWLAGLVRRIVAGLRGDGDS